MRMASRNRACLHLPLDNREISSIILELWNLKRQSLVQAGSDGLTVGSLQESTGHAGATLSNHLNTLRRAGLIRDRRVSRNIWCRADYGQMNALITVYGTDFGLRDATWISRFTDATRQAVTYRRGRVLLAGDAAHVHPPQGGQGMQTGIQDAVNLGWKLAQVVDGASPESLLDSYHAERHPVGARVLQNTMAQVTISKPDARHRALRDTMAELLTMDEPRRYIGAMLTALDVHYDLGGGHPLIGRRMPDLDLHTPSGPSRVFAELHDARPVLLNFGEPGGLGSVVRTDRVRLIDAQLVDSRGVGTLELPVIGEVAAPAGVLIRPDGHVAWAGEPAAPGLPEALSTWFGAAASAT